MKRILVVVPVPLDETGMANRRAQGKQVSLGPDVELVYRMVQVAPKLFDNYFDFVIGDIGMVEAAMRAEEEGFHAVCIDATGDLGVNALRSLLNIPVIGPARVSYFTALMLGNNFSILTQWGRWKAGYRRLLREYGLENRCVSIRSTEIPPNLRDMLGGSLEEVLPALIREAEACIADGAEVICLGATTMYAAAPYLSERLPVPVINPGPLSYKIAEAMIDLRLSQSRAAFQQGANPDTALVNAMIRGAVQSGNSSKPRA